MGKRVKRGTAKSLKPVWLSNTLKSAGRALKAKAKKPAMKIKLGHDTPSKPDAVVTRIEKLEYPKGLPPRPAGTRWPKEINIGKRHRKEFGDIEALALSYNERGAIIQPIAITGDNDLIAGERRLKAWVHPKSNFVAKPIPVHVISIDSIVAGEWDENAHRKDFTPSEAVSIKREIEVLLKKHAKDRQRAHGGTTHGRKSTATDKLNVGERAAAMTGKKRRTLEKAEKIEDAAELDPKRFGKLRDDMNRTGRVDGPFKRLQVMRQTDALRNAPSPLPMRGPYMVLSVDYPWPAERDAEQADIDKRGRSMRDYPEMAIATGEKLFKSKEFRALLAPAHTVYFWTTNFHMEDAFVLLNAMGFEKHSTIGTWVKNKMGRGQVLRGQTEHCIIATRGKPTINLTTQTTRWEGAGWEVREDSRKPDAFYGLVEELTPAPRYAEIFSRGGRNEKWDCHGDQAGKFAAVDATLEEVKRGHVTGPKRNRKKPTPLEAAIEAASTVNGASNYTARKKAARRTLPGRNAKLISFAETQGHIVSMTLSVDGEESIGTCECGFEHREPRHGEPGDASDPAIVEKRMASAAAMDAAITDHWRIQKGLKPVLQPTADEPAAEPDGEDQVAAAAVLPAGTNNDDNQLDIPGFLKRQHA